MRLLSMHLLAVTIFAVLLLAGLLHYHQLAQRVGPDRESDRVQKRAADLLLDHLQPPHTQSPMVSSGKYTRLISEGFTWQPPAPTTTPMRQGVGCVYYFRELAVGESVMTPGVCNYCTCGDDGNMHCNGVGSECVCLRPPYHLGIYFRFDCFPPSGRRCGLQWNGCKLGQEACVSLATSCLREDIWLSQLQLCERTELCLCNTDDDCDQEARQICRVDPYPSGRKEIFHNIGDVDIPTEGSGTGWKYCFDEVMYNKTLSPLLLNTNKPHPSQQ